MALSRPAVAPRLVAFCQTFDVCSHGIPRSGRARSWGAPRAQDFGGITVGPDQSFGRSSKNKNSERERRIVLSRVRKIARFEKVVAGFIDRCLTAFGKGDLA